MLNVAQQIADLWRAISPLVTLRAGVIEGAGGGLATLRLGGASVTGVPYLATYTPVVGHKVYVLQGAGVLIILGRTA